MHYKTEIKRTTNHNKIMDWAKNRNGKPVRLPKVNENEPGLGPIKIHFPEDNEEFEEITWNEFLDDFEKKKLQMIYQEDTEEGKPSYFYLLEKRHPENSFVQS
ncbi:MAG TPA: hypothetical protein VIK89_06680 [Cytophagaceae bacterium]